MSRCVRCYSLFLFCTLFWVGLPVAGQQVQPRLSAEAQVSVLTSAPWPEEVYALFGHTALRVHDPLQEVDVVFNYGLFDFSQPHFLYHFVRGETDYQLGMTSYYDYLLENEMRDLRTTEQFIALDSSQTTALWQALLTNYRPEHRCYRYNFFFDNCATRPLWQIEAQLPDSISFRPLPHYYTFRQLVHQCTDTYPWLTFGIDLAIGRDADRVATLREHLFLPGYLQEALSTATVGGRPLVREEQILIPGDALGDDEVDFDDDDLLSPEVVSMLLLVIVFALLRAKSPQGHLLSNILQSTLFFLAALGGIVIAFLVFFSVHPTVNRNIHLLWLHPLQWLVPLLLVYKRGKKMFHCYHFCNFVAIAAFLSSPWWYGQVLPTAACVMALSLWLYSMYDLYTAYKTK